MTKQESQGGSAPLRTAKYPEVMEALNISHSRIRHLWKELPHSYVGNPDKQPSIRHARFNIEEIVKWAASATEA